MEILFYFVILKEGEIVEIIRVQANDVLKVGTDRGEGWSFSEEVGGIVKPLFDFS